MKNEFLNSKNVNILSKKAQKNVQGGLWGSSNCLLTGCHAHYPGSPDDGIVGRDGGPCAIATPTGQSCIGTARNGKCCIGSFN